MIRTNYTITAGQPIFTGSDEDTGMKVNIQLALFAYVD